MNKENGFTLIEFLITVAVLAIGVFALIALQVTATRTNYSSKTMTVGAMLAEKKMEQIKNTPFNSLTVVTNQADSNNPMNASEQPGGIFSRFWTISNYAGSANMRQIIVTVSWTEKGQTKNTSLSTIISR